MAISQATYERILRKEFGTFEVGLQHFHDRLNFIVGVCESAVRLMGALEAERFNLQQQRLRFDKRVKANRKTKKRK